MSKNEQITKMATIQFTRYLYLKDEVEFALIIAMMNKTQDSLFWAYELYYSGLIKELVSILFIIYYDFYATLNPGFEAYILKKCKTPTPLTVAQIINNLLIRPSNLDVFMLRREVAVYELEEVSKAEIGQLFIDKNYTQIAKYVLEDCRDIPDLITQTIAYFTKMLKTSVMMATIKLCNKPHALLAKIMHYYSVMNNNKMGKNLYLTVQESDIVMYETITDEVPSYKVLQTACLYGIDDHQYLSLFDLQRNKLVSHQVLQECYHRHWLYYASSTPVWYGRIIAFNGKIDHANKTVTFPDEERIDRDTTDFEDFHNLYDYEPDEQKQETQDKNIRGLHPRGKADPTSLGLTNVHKCNSDNIPTLLGLVNVNDFWDAPVWNPTGATPP